MSVALALYYFSRWLGSVQALPFDKRAISACTDLNNCRTTSDIVWSCLTTTFSCTWVAIHPNIPAPYESSFEIGLRRLGVVIMALIAPELVIMWAMRQWIVARRLAKEQRAKGWTQTHGFFALMGGFMLFDGDKPLYTLSPEKLDELSRARKIVFPKITKKEIEDKSKGDVLSKGFVIVQTGWFVLQCIARGVERLPITELELVTLAFAVLNFTTYALWWNKPLNVDCPFSVYLVCENSDQPNDKDRIPGMFKRATQSMIETWHKKCLFLPIMPFLNMGLGHGKDGMVTGAKKVPSFYSGDGNGNIIGSILLPSAAVIGAIHGIAWSFQFPSQSKEILWRTCYLIITFLPVSLVSFAKLAAVFADVLDRRGGVAAYVSRIFAIGLAVVAVAVFPIIYIVARVILLVEAFVLLKSLPPGAFQTVQWTTFIPHV
ncbi:hypothetical protein BD410DRAFT_845987 [Rickenella mellea]|uniref:Uncharacterized protein n=1 Tax=Rickenella mellea TaxID=50990 RepID=A0A4Y7PJ97_9AGAM|nr:hypothetical protein BD410DRAFT_845987 [Rickenella mellea]